MATSYQSGFFRLLDPTLQSLVDICFSESELLIALTGIPDYSLQVYHWRSKELLLTKASGIITDKQKIGCSPSLPLNVCQFAYTQAKLTVWEIHATVKICRIIERKVKLPFDKDECPASFTFSIDGTLNVVNKSGNVYSVIPLTNQVNEIIKWTAESGPNRTCLSYGKGGLVLAGPDGRVKFFKRQRGYWAENWSATPFDPILLLRTFQNKENLIGATVNGNLVKIVMENDQRAVSFETIKEYDINFSSFIMLSPIGNVLVTVNQFNSINVLSVENGEKLATIETANHSCLKGNTVYPYIAVGSTTGVVFLVSLFDPKRPKMLTEFHLSYHHIYDIIFSENGSSMYVFDKGMNVFRIQGFPGGIMNVTLHVTLNNLIIEPILTENESEIEILALKKASDKLLKLTVDRDEEVKEETFILPMKYNTIMRIFEKPTLFFAIPYLSKKIHVICLSDDKIQILKEIKTEHRVNSFNAYVDQFNLITWGLDGMVNIFDVANYNQIAGLICHNRHSMGIKEARCDALHQ